MYTDIENELDTCGSPHRAYHLLCQAVVGDRPNDVRRILESSWRESLFELIKTANLFQPVLVAIRSGFSSVLDEFFKYDNNRTIYDTIHSQGVYICIVFKLNVMLRKIYAHSRHEFSFVFLNQNIMLAIKHRNYDALAFLLCMSPPPVVKNIKLMTALIEMDEPEYVIYYIAPILEVLNYSNIRKLVAPLFKETNIRKVKYNNKSSFNNSVEALLKTCLDKSNFIIYSYFFLATLEKCIRFYDMYPEIYELCIEYFRFDVLSNDIITKALINCLLEPKDKVLELFFQKIPVSYIVNPAEFNFVSYIFTRSEFYPKLKMLSEHAAFKPLFSYRPFYDLATKDEINSQIGNLFKFEELSDDLYKESDPMDLQSHVLQVLPENSKSFTKDLIFSPMKEIEVSSLNNSKVNTPKTASARSGKKRAMSINPESASVRRGRIGQAVSLINNDFANEINNNQSSHTTSVLRSVSESCDRLKNHYQSIIDEQGIKAIKEKFVHFLHNIPSSTNQYLETDIDSDDEVNSTHDIHIKFAKMYINKVKFVDMKSRHDFDLFSYQDLETGVRLDQLLCYLFLGIEDEDNRLASKEDYIFAFVRGLYEASREYNINEYGVDDGSYFSMPACPAGCFNKAVESLTGFHKDCQLIYINQRYASDKFTILCNEESIHFIENCDDKGLLQKLYQNILTQDYSVIWPYIKDAVIKRFMNEFGQLYSDNEQHKKCREIFDGVSYINCEKLIRNFRIKLVLTPMSNSAISTNSNSTTNDSGHIRKETMPNLSDKEQEREDTSSSEVLLIGIKNNSAVGNVNEGGPMKKLRRLL